MFVKVRINNKEETAQAQIVQDTLWLHHNGRTISVDVGGKRKSRRKGGAVSSPDKITAPMPGKVTKILTSEGSQLEAGAAILVMEAMKMEYTLKAEAAGVVEKIGCQVGDQVALGKLLVQLKL